MRPVRSKKIWIDLDNSPHVPFFLPIIDELDKRGYQIVLTARNTYQVSELLRFHGLLSKVKVGGHHWGRNRFLKIIGTCLRAVQLVPTVLKEKPDLAVSHGSRAQMISARLTGVPSIVIFDYEFASFSTALQPDWAFAPDIISDSAVVRSKSRLMKYPGLKEDVYIHRLRTDPSLKRQLGLHDDDLIVTVRPPATEAHYHNPESERLLEAVLDRCTHLPEVRVVLVPRNEKQAQTLRTRWNRWVENRKILIPERVVDGLNLIWLSDLIVSGGGTMNREAAALGVPVYSIFRGRIGAVDQYLADTGRLILIEHPKEVETKIVIKRRAPVQPDASQARPALTCIVNAISSIAEHQCLPT